MSNESFNPEADREWLQQWSRGAVSAFEVVYELFGKQLIAYLSGRCNNPEDVASEVWLSIWKHRASFQSGNFRAWMFQIARNHLISQSRRKYTTAITNESLHSIAFIESPKEDSETLSKLKCCLEKLQGLHLDVLRERLKGKSTKELADQFEITEANVAKRIWNAKTLLRQCVENQLS